MSISLTRITRTMLELASIPSTSGHEDEVRDYLMDRLHQLGLATQVDSAGNLLARLDGTGEPLLLNAHMDRVPPGLAHTPVLREGVLFSDGTTNLGADDSAGLAIVLELLARVQEEKMPHPPLVVVFTVQEETGLKGAATFDPEPWQVREGLVFDNAFEAGVVVSKGSTYIAFDVEISGRTGHPGKDLEQTINALEIFRAAQYPHGILADDQTRILIGRVTAGTARNAVPASVQVQGELRSFEPAEARERYLYSIRAAFEEAALKYGGSVHFTFESHCTNYTVNETEPLLQLYRDALARRNQPLRLQPTFIGSDTSALRPRVKALTISTGVVNEHSTAEYVPLEPLAGIVEDVLWVFEKRA
jgi:tripeptide aminopeptidase